MVRISAKGNAGDRQSRISLRTVLFLGFMIVFFGTAVFLTYYSKIVFIRNLPTVNTVMPERMDKNDNGRFSYIVPADALHKDDMNHDFVLTARHLVDILGDRYEAVLVYVWVLERQEEGMVLIDGLTQEEPVIVGTGDTVGNGDSILYR